MEVLKFFFLTISSYKQRSVDERYPNQGYNDRRHEGSNTVRRNGMSRVPPRTFTDSAQLLNLLVEQALKDWVDVWEKEYGMSMPTIALVLKAELPHQAAIKLSLP